jgi:hypothetical protein
MNTNQQETIQKYTGAIARGLIGQVPVIGSLTVELLNITIPNQRQERIEKLLNILSQKIFNISEEELKNKFHSTDFIDIFEDVLRQSVRATSEIRLRYLASVLKNGIDSQKFDHLQNKRLLEILEKINDIEVILLRSYSLRDDTSEYQDFINKYSDIFNDKEKQEETKSSKTNDKDRQNFINHYDDNLISLGLVGVNQNNERVPTTTIPDLTTGLLPTRLGVNLLKLIGFEQLELDDQDSEKNIRVAESINALDVYQNLLKTSENIHSSLQDTKMELSGNGVQFMRTGLGR